MDPLNINIFESDEEEELDQLVFPRHPKVFKYRTNYFEELDDLEFFKRTCEMLLNIIEDNIKSETNRNNAVSPESKLFVTLRYYATGSMLIAAADFAGVSKTSACTIVTQVTAAIASLRQRYIKLPETQEEQQATKEQFYRIARFPHVIGVIDCTHIRIQSPGGDEAERYRNRKAYFSWNVQTVCDARLRIMDIVALWPGSTHDQTIFNNSRIKGRLENNQFGSSVILGDSGYGNTNFLLTPLEHPNARAQILYNESQIRTRNCVERAYGVWKRRFPILSVGMRVSQENSKAIIVAAAVLHNLAIQEHEDEPPNDTEIEDVPVPLPYAHNDAVNQENNRTRNLLINNHFTNLV